MIIYSIILFAVALLTALISISIYRGNTNLIINYHQSRVRLQDKKQYGRDFAKGLSCLCLTFLLSGLAGLLSNSLKLADIILFAGIILSIIILVIVQKRYNRGIF
ncbi:MAG: hypothetical protein IKE93_09930 [Erysipelotrichaceae bacterium]|nr:hypothetical protein [Erysipelotrichaceae bacterium]